MYIKCEHCGKDRAALIDRRRKELTYYCVHCGKNVVYVLKAPVEKEPPLLTESEYDSAIQ